MADNPTGGASKGADAASKASAPQAPPVPPATDGQRRPVAAGARQQAAATGRGLLAWRLRGLPPGLGTFEWLAASSLRMPTATTVALLATWTAALFALWVAVYSAIGSAVLLITGTAASGHAAGLFHFTEHTGISLDFVGILAAFFIGFGLGFAGSYADTLNHGIPEVAAAILIGIVLGVVIGLVAIWTEPTMLRARGYRRPSRQEWETTLKPAISAARDAMGLKSLPLFLVVDTPVPLAWTVARHVVLSTGLMTGLHASELQGVIAHELAHWRRGDGIALRMVWAFSWPLAALYTAGMVLSGARLGTPTSAEDAADRLKVNKNVLSFIAWLILWPSYVLMRYLIGPATAHESRQMEYEADAAVVRAGLGGGLQRALERLSPFEPGRTAFEAVLSSRHPPTALRIEAIQDADPLVSEPEIPELSRSQAGWLVGICFILLVCALSYLVPGHGSHAWHVWKLW